MLQLARDLAALLTCCAAAAPLFDGLDTMLSFCAFLRSVSAVELAPCPSLLASSAICWTAVITSAKFCIFYSLECERFRFGQLVWRSFRLAGERSLLFKAAGGVRQGLKHVLVVVVAAAFEFGLDAADVVLVAFLE